MIPSQMHWEPGSSLVNSFPHPGTETEFMTDHMNSVLRPVFTFFFLGNKIGFRQSSFGFKHNFGSDVSSVEALAGFSRAENFTLRFEHHLVDILDHLREPTTGVVNLCPESHKGTGSLCTWHVGGWGRGREAQWQIWQEAKKNQARSRGLGAESRAAHWEGDWSGTWGG